MKAIAIISLLVLPALNLLAGPDWTAAQWIGNDVARDTALPPPVLLRGTFRLDAPVRKATLHSTALGFAEVHVNGKEVGNDRFAPGWTDYNKRVYYRSVDVTAMLAQGENVVGAVVADGWFSGRIGWGGKRNYYGTKPRFRAVLEVELTDGKRQVFTTDASWQGSTGPWIYADFLQGENYDARRELTGWDRAGFAADGWQPVACGAEVNPLVEPAPGPPVVVFAEMKPLSVERLADGKIFVNFGRNFAGVVRLRLNGKAGQTLTLHHAERLDKDGSIYTKNLRSAPSVDTYTCRDGAQIWAPRFTYHGFQYITIDGWDGTPADGDITGLAIGSDIQRVGAFQSSYELLNKLVENVYWTQRSNFMSIPTDCPQRDERLGWTGDAQVFIRTATYVCDVHDFFCKWHIDLADAQFPGGAIPPVAPSKVAEGLGGAAWEDAAVLCPWTIYQVYQDKEQLARAWPMMDALLAHKRSTLEADYRPKSGVHCFGDWLSLDDPTSSDVIRLAYFIRSSDVAAEAAVVLGKPADAARHRAEATRARQAFRQFFVKPDGRIEGPADKIKVFSDSQTGYVLALSFDLVEGAQRDQVVAHLLRRIEECKWHLATGFVGSRDLLHVLSQNGHSDVAYRLLSNEDYPGWLFPVTQGATSIWERWDGWHPQRGFQTPDMNSFAHYAYGAVYQWMVENIGGIHSAAPGFAKVLISPVLPPADSEAGLKLTWANVDYRSPAGPIKSGWKRDGTKVTYQIDVPVAAEVSLAAGPHGRITGASSGPVSKGRHQITLAPGHHQITTE